MNYANKYQAETTGSVLTAEDYLRLKGLSAVALAVAADAAIDATTAGHRDPALLAGAVEVAAEANARYAGAVAAQAGADKWDRMAEAAMKEYFAQVPPSEATAIRPFVQANPRGTLARLAAQVAWQFEWSTRRVYPW